MRKRYIPVALGRGDAYWEDQWSSASIERSIRFCDIDPLRPVFEKYLPRPPGRILEAGCGLGQYVIYYGRRGYSIEGVDFAGETLRRVKQYDPGARVCVADVRSLPYPPGYFEAYFSGGVIEHFEEGPHAVLREACRVLTHNGTLIVTVPFLNLARRAVDYVGASGRRDARGIGNLVANGRRFFNYLLVDRYDVLPENLEGVRFHEYYHSSAEIVSVLEDVGFRVVEAKPFSVMWGLQDSWLFRNALKAFQRRSGQAARLGRCGTDDGQSAGAANRERDRQGAGFRQRLLAEIKKVVVGERHHIPALDWSIKAIAHLFGHMIALVCVKDRASEGTSGESDVDRKCAAVVDRR